MPISVIGLIYITGKLFREHSLQFVNWVTQAISPYMNAMKVLYGIFMVLICMHLISKQVKRCQAPSDFSNEKKSCYHISLWLWNAIIVGFISLLYAPDPPNQSGIDSVWAIITIATILQTVLLITQIWKMAHRTIKLAGSMMLLIFTVFTRILILPVGSQPKLQLDYFFITKITDISFIVFGYTHLNPDYCVLYLCEFLLSTLIIVYTVLAAINIVLMLTGRMIYTKPMGQKEEQD